jgi:methylated-DNA-protein-cysteine methyltransferase-like protein
LSHIFPSFGQYVNKILHFFSLENMKKEIPIFSKKVRELARTIPKGMVTTYGLLARASGGGGQAARSVAGILGKDPMNNEIPFHRIVFSSGKVWVNDVCSPARMKLYKKEGIEVNEKGKILNFGDVLYTFN